MSSIRLIHPGGAATPGPGVAASALGALRSFAAGMTLGQLLKIQMSADNIVYVDVPVTNEGEPNGTLGTLPHFDVTTGGKTTQLPADWLRIVSLNTVGGAMTVDVTSEDVAGGSLPVTLLARVVGNTAVSGPIGTPPLSAAVTVDAYNMLIATQTTAGISINLQPPTNPKAGRVVLVASLAASTQSFLLANALGGKAVTVNPGDAVWMEWDGAEWGQQLPITNGGNRNGATTKIQTVDGQALQIGTNSTICISINGTTQEVTIQTVDAGGGALPLTVVGTSAIGTTTTIVNLDAAVRRAGVEMGGGAGGAHFFTLETDRASAGAQRCTLTDEDSSTIVFDVDDTNFHLSPNRAAGPGPFLGAVVHDHAVADTPGATVLDGTGSLGAAAATVNVTSFLMVDQTTPVILQANMRTIPAPTANLIVGRVLTVVNIGTAPFTLGDAGLLQGVNLTPGCGSRWMWDGSAWIPTGETQTDYVQANTNVTGTQSIPRAGRRTQYTVGTIGGDIVLTAPDTNALLGDEILITRPTTDAHLVTVDNAVGTEFVQVVSKKNFTLLRYNGTHFVFAAGGMN